MKGRDLFRKRGAPQPSARREDLMARTLAEEYRSLFDDLRASARGGPWEILRRLRELVGRKDVDVGRLRQRLNRQFVAETERVIRDLLADGGERLARELGSFSIPAMEAFGSRLAGIRDLYLDDAAARIDGEQDELKRTFLERLEAWATTGGELDVADIVERMKEAADGRAKFFARDQFSRFNRSVAVASYREAGAEFAEWLTSNDTRVRPEHKARNHRIYTQAELEADPEWKSYNCFLPGTMVQGPIVSALKSFYLGSVIRIVTTGRKELSVTSNHPIFTGEGWRRACDVREGDRLFGYLGNSEGPTLPVTVGRAPDEQYAPSPVEDVFRALPGHRTVECRATYLHGDGKRIKGDIEISGAASLLPNDRVSQTVQFLGKAGLEPAFSSIRRISGVFPEQRDLFGEIGSVNSSSRGPGGGTLSLYERLILLDGNPFYPLRLGSAARVDARVNETAKNC